ncbi:MAG: DUF4838 domain-containing protein [Ruminococcaceae bacterium]|nr:DUF4838 domain-containing protein [Oscillospiraceae bacterium]
MNRILSLILAALLLAASVVSCGNGDTTTDETKSSIDVVETKAPETVPDETNAPASSYDTTLVTENGTALAHIVVAEGAGVLEKYAAEELRYHIQKVSGAEISVTNTVRENSLPIIICTPESLPELETLFPEDLNWLRDLGEAGSNERWGSDGFAIRSHEGKVYIFGATGKGALNGVYDFIEENLGVLWIRADEEIGLVYDEMPTVTVQKTDYREKSPFEVRGWNLCANNGSGESELVTMRNKLNSVGLLPAGNSTAQTAVRNGMVQAGANHNVKNLVLSSPIYDPNCTEYWNTDDEGNPLPVEESVQINFYSDKAAEAIAAGLISIFKAGNTKAYPAGIEDYDGTGRVAPNDTLPFEYAPGQFVNPDDPNYASTVFFTFLNKVARLVKAECPDATIDTFAYFFTQAAPACDVEDNIRVVFAPIYCEDLSAPIDDPDNIHNARLVNDLSAWRSITPNLVIYNYYGCYWPANSYERPIWRKIQGDLRYYAAMGITGVLPEGDADCKDVIRGFSPDDHGGSSNVWGMNSLTFWLYHKLSWNPEEDVDALIKEFCDKCYGEASPHMLEYYRLLEKGWTEGKNDYFMWSVSPKELYLYMDNFVYLPDLEDEMIAALQNAWDAADDVEKERIRRIKEVYENYFAE